MNVIRYLKAPILKVDSNINEMLHLNRKLLSFVGIWPLEPDASYLTKMCSLLRIITTSVLCVIMITLQLITLYINWGDIGVMSVDEMLESIVKNVVFPEDQEERNNIVELANHSRICTILYYYAILFQIPLTIFGAALGTVFNYATANGTVYNRRLPNDLYYGIYCQIPPYYEILFTIQSLATIFGATASAGLNSTTMAIVMHLAGQFRVVSLRLKAIGRMLSDGYRYQNKPTNALAMKIKLCIVHHERVLSAFEFARDLLGPLIFGLFVIAGIEICFTGWAVMKSNNNLANTIKFAMLFMTMWLQLTLWSWSGEAIIRESTNIGQVAFNDIPWFTLPCSMQRDFSFIVRRAQRQPQLDAMGMQVMHMKKLTEVFNAAMSYMALLRSMAE